ncbi:MAG: dienelactone hydrolase family protein [Gracilimonas sp.]|uniref:dienelactone hydrolase family protein n=1 Tax=Gracilimonas sp. TaxID=1974203 RepID=UPI0037515B03|nr:dienelactone hydrolase family protein [Gracilimonas sp.]
MKKLLFTAVITLLTLPVFAQDYAVEQLENSPRHHEWVTIESNDRTLHNFVVYPETSEPAPIVIVIHENRGLNDWARSFADQLAGKGFIAVAPDLISNTVDEIEKTSDFKTSDAAREALYDLEPDHVTTDLMNVLEYAKTIKAGDGTFAVAGFCWGGSQSFRFATNAGDAIDAAFVFYGTGPGEAEAYRSIEVPVYGFYGGNDQRVNSTIEDSEAAMNEFGKTYEYEIYEGAGHAYMRSGDDPERPNDDANVQARNESWERLVSLLNSL